MTMSAAAWLASDSALARRWLVRSAITPSTSRPTIAMAVVIATATPAVLRPVAGSRNAIRCTRKPACDSSESENGADTLQKA